MLATAGVLFVGLVGLLQGGAFNERYGNRLMRARVGLQLLAVIAAGPPVPHPGLSAGTWSSLSQIYTRGGDQGRTSLGDGTRVAKHTARVAAYGTVDEANATIGLARLHTADDADAMLARIQNDLFDLGADLCRPGQRFRGRQGAAHPRKPGRASGARDRRDERRAAAADLVRAAGRQRRCGLPASRPHRDAAQPSGWSASWPRPRRSIPPRSAI